ncbi:MAG: ABC transporter ATP-binding protein [Planctomycetes bacterium]|nr:ABC transporter ATP-binding protein [Planctomycetota bacterium]MBI3843834.1 ABC transporter ATP-binding protein [Planctomycetota bacterium]
MLDDDYAVITEGLTKTYGDKAAVSHLDLRVKKGEFFGFLGPNGAGKSTTIKMLCGLLLPTSGRMTVLGHDVVADPLAVKAMIGILPEDINTYERLTGWELLTFTGRMYGLSRAEAEQRTEQLLRLVELNEEDRHKLVVDYSLGMKKKTTLACALIHNPKVLFLDEPFNGIDAITGSALREALRRATERGVTIFFSSHVLEVVEKLCTRIAIIHKGTLQAEGTVAEIAAARGFAPGTGLEQLFVEIAGGQVDRGDLSWMS